MTEELKVPTKKQKRIEKQNRRKHPEISNKIILAWEELRQKTVKLERKYELCSKIMETSKSFIGDLIRQRVTARVFESVIEFGTDEHRWTIFEIIKNDILELCKGKYSYFAIIQMLKSGTKEQRLSVFQQLVGHIVSLLQHSFACKVVEAAYNDFANSKQRSIMIQEFYGKAFSLFSDGKEIKHLSDFTSNSHFDMSIIQNIHKVLIPIISKTQIDLTIIQHVLFEYISVLVEKCHKLDENELKENICGKFLEEILELVHEQVLKLCNTRQGTRVAIMVFCESNTKMRKKIVQSTKEVILEICTHEDGHLFVLSILDQLDDTKLLDKSVIKPILQNIEKIVDNIHGRKIIHFILNHRDKRYFANFVLDILKLGDGNRYSKKDPEIRSREILDMASIPMLKWVESHIDEMLKFPHSINIVHSVLTRCLPTNDDMKTQYKNILKSTVVHIDEPVIPSELSMKRKQTAQKSTVPKKKATPFTGTYEIKEDETPEEEKSIEIECHLLESIGGNVLFKSLCKMEKEGKIEGFSSYCLDISVDNLQTYIKCNRSAFFLVFLYEIGDSKIQEFLKNNLSSMKNLIKKSDLPSLKILSNHLFGK